MKSEKLMSILKGIWAFALLWLEQRGTESQGGGAMEVTFDLPKYWN